ncbi:serine/threonine-protein kinase [Gordonia sp. DT30]|uniref:serine/threonine-protein kinase n=1 Tax=Gordonia sp. DT30 TaxID=3416546 RepID=UPI003CEE5EAC
MGETVAGFVIEAAVGHGSSADVYRVHRTDGSGPWALKVLHGDDADAGRARERFEREFTIASLLDHPHIVSMVDRGEVRIDTAAPGTRLWLAMQYVAGPSATSLIPLDDRQPRVSVVLRVAQQIGDALDYAHTREVLHRDVKPANILLTTATDDADGVLSDFGIARLLDDTRPLARNGRVQGSVAYAAPELLAAQQLSPATDVYSFACALVELFTGTPPFPRSTAFAITHAHIRDDPPKLTRRRAWLPSALDSVFAKALAKNPADRYQTCAEFVDIITRALRDVPVPPDEPRRRRWSRGPA